MNPLDPASFNHRHAKLSKGNSYHFVDQQPENPTPNTPTLLLVHGFPDFWYGWRKQIGPWVRQGFRVIVPDMLGYGETDSPKNAELYSTKNLSEDLVALLDFIGVQKVFVIGHDWGSMITWRFCLWHPERVIGAVTLSVPYTPPPRTYISPEEAAASVPNFGYQLFFSEPRSTELLDAHLTTFLSSMVFREKGGNEAPSWLGVGALEGQLKALGTSSSLVGPSRLPPKELEYYIANTKRNGMNGPLSYYRTTKIRFEEERDAELPAMFPANIPVLFFYGTQDGTCSQKHVVRMRKFVPLLEDVAVEGHGHWLMIDAEDIVTNKVTAWIRSILNESSAKL